MFSPNFCFAYTFSKLCGLSKDSCFIRTSCSSTSYGKS